MSVFEKCFRDKTVMVTGAGRGIGRAVAVELWKCGAKVYAVSKNPDNLSPLKKECPSITTISVDLGDWTATKDALSAIQQPIDCLVNNAAIFKSAPFMEINPEDFDSLMNVNLKGVVNVSQIIAGKLIEAGKAGSIVNISSVGGRKAYPTGGVYCMTKAGMEMLTKVMAIELGKHKIRVNSINPAGVETDMLLQSVLGSMTPTELKTVWAAWEERTPSGVFMMPMPEVVNTILFMLSDLGTQITGESLAIDGGFLIA